MQELPASVQVFSVLSRALIYFIGRCFCLSRDAEGTDIF